MRTTTSPVWEKKIFTTEPADLKTGYWSIGYRVKHSMNGRDFTVLGFNYAKNSTKRSTSWAFQASSTPFIIWRYRLVAIAILW